MTATAAPLREFLKENTASEHSKLDLYFNGLTLSNFEQAYLFVQSQIRSFEIVSNYVKSFANLLLPKSIADEFHETETRGQQLHYLELKTIQENYLASNPSYLYLIGILYVLKGSQLGANFMRKAFLESKNPKVVPLNEFFVLKGNFWKIFTNFLNDLSINRSQCLAGSNATFHIFNLVFSKNLQSSQ